MSKLCVVAVSREFGEIDAVRKIVGPFGYPLVNRSAPDNHVLIGTIEDEDHHYGPIIVLEEKGHSLKVRVPWRYIYTIIYAGKLEAQKMGFAAEPEEKALRKKRQ